MIPKASHDPVAGKLTTTLNTIVRFNYHESWKSLLSFPKRFLRAPKRWGHHWKLSKQIHQCLSEEEDVIFSTTMRNHATKRGISDRLQCLATRVSAKLEEGSVRVAVCLACSEDSITEVNDATLAVLQSKRPAPHPDSSMPSPPNSIELNEALLVEEGDLARAIHLFPKGST